MSSYRELLDEVRTATAHRNDTLNRAAFTAFRHAKTADPDEVEREFIKAGLAAGLGEHEVRTTVRCARTASAV